MGSLALATKHINKELRNFFDLSQEAFARLIGVGGEKAVEDLQSIKESLEAQIEQEEIDRWLHAPNPMFDGKTPVKAMIEGKTDDILDILIRLEEGIHN
jgi:hypothetical protein